MVSFQERSTHFLLSSLLVDRYHDEIALENICTFGPFPHALKRGPHLGVFRPFPAGSKVNPSGVQSLIHSRSRRDFVVEERVEQVHFLLDSFVKMADHVSAPIGLGTFTKRLVSYSLQTKLQQRIVEKVLNFDTMSVSFGNAQIGPAAKGIVKQADKSQISRVSDIQPRFFTYRTFRSASGRSGRIGRVGGGSPSRISESSSSSSSSSL